MKLSELKRRYKHGASLEVLADLTDCTVVEIARAVGVVPKFDKEIHRRYWELYGEGKSDPEVAKLTDTKTAQVRAWRRTHGLEINPSHGKVGRNEDKVYAMYLKGFSDVQIGEEIGVSRSAIRKWRKKNRLPSVAKPGPKPGGAKK